MMIMDSETQGFLAINDAAVDHYGYSRKEFLKLNAADIRPPEEIEAAVKRIRELKPDVDRLGVWKHRKKDGTIIDVEIVSHEIEFNSRPARLAMCNDVTEKLMAQEKVRESEERFRTTFQMSPDIMTITRVSNGVYIDVNSTFVRITGYKRDEVIGKSSLDIAIWVHPEQRRELVDQLKETGSVENMEAQFKKKDGTIFSGLTSWQVVTFEKEPHLLGVIKDITELKEAEERFRTTFQMSPDIMTISRLSDGVFADVNDAFVRITGYKRDEVIGKSSLDLKVWVQPDRRGELLDQLKETGAIENMEAQWRKKDGTIFSGLMSWQMVAFENEPHLLGVVKDITELKEAEERVKESEKRFRTTFELSPDVMAISRVSDGVYVDINDAFARIIGYDRDEVIGRSSLDLEIWAHPEKREELVYLLKRDSIVENMEVEYRKKDGTTFPGLSSCQVVTLENEPHLLVIVKNITELKEAEDRLKESEERFRTAFEFNPDIVTISKVDDGTLLIVNDAFVKIVGTSREEAIGRSTRDVGLWSSSSEDREKFIAILQKEGFINDLEILLKMKDGTDFHGLLNSIIVTMQGEPRLLTFIKDITLRKQMEEQIKKSLEEKELLLKEVHHRVKNNLQAVAGLLNLQSELVKDEEVSTFFKENEARIHAMALIHEKLYQVGDLSRINIKDYIETLTDRLVRFYSLSPGRVKIIVKAAKVSLNLDTIIPVGLILNELVSNALKYAFPDNMEGEVRVSLSKRKDGSLSLKVSDNGIGLPDEVDIGRSGSLGMMLVKGFVDGLSGTVKLDRRSGTAITITFHEYLEQGVEFTS